MIVQVTKCPAFETSHAIPEEVQTNYFSSRKTSSLFSLPSVIAGAGICMAVLVGAICAARLVQKSHRLDVLITSTVGVNCVAVGVARASIALPIEVPSAVAVDQGGIRLLAPLEVPNSVFETRYA